MLTVRVQKYALLALALAAPGVIALSCAPSLTFVGAGGAGGSGGAGTGSDTTSSGGRDAGHDAAHDAGHDAAHDGGRDAEHDAENDAESDASDASDGEIDASDSGDAGDGSDGCMPSLTDPTNCGACGHDCCGGACIDGVCQAYVVSSGFMPGVLAVDATYVYWPDAQNTADGGIMRAVKTGGPATPLTTGQAYPFAVAVDANFIYWTTNSNNPPDYGGVFKAPIGGGAVMPLVPSGEIFANYILVNGTSVFWDNYAPTNQIRRSALDGTSLTTVAQSTDGVSTPTQMAIDSQFIYWSGRFGAAVQRAPLNGVGAANLSTSKDAVSVAVDANNIYWANYQDGSIQKAPLAGGTATTIATSGGDGPWSLAVDANFIYWADQGKPSGAGTDGGANGSIRVVPINVTSGVQGTVLAESANPKWVALDTSCVYWSDTTTGNIYVVAKPSP